MHLLVHRWRSTLNLLDVREAASMLVVLAALAGCFATVVATTAGAHHGHIACHAVPRSALCDWKGMYWPHKTRSSMTT